MSVALLEKAAEIIKGVSRPELAAELVLALARDAHWQEFKAERERDQARDRKARQRDKDRDISVTEDGTSAGQQRDGERDTAVTVPPAPPSGSFSDLIRSPDPSKPDQEDPRSDERPGPVTRYSSNFIAFWLVYPSKVGKEAAWKAWKRLQPDLSEIQRALIWQRTSKQWREGIIPNPATYLNQKRWLDERRDIGVTSAGLVGSTQYQPADTYLDQRDRCEFHREAGNDAIRAPEAVSWCRRCQRLIPRAAGGAR